ncbi:hypothetical protein ACPV47_23775 [Vibrio jasicida]|uniref:hypothetical protein n=1 Tax=Vibrio jasicida TaxID=766224 RepID=UPI004069762A
MNGTIRLNWQLYTYMAVFSIITGCGGEDGFLDDERTEKAGVRYYAQDNISKGSFGDLKYVDLSESMISVDNGLVRLKSVEILSEKDNCAVISKSDSGFSIDAEKAKVCDYRFNVGGPIQSESEPAGQESNLSTAITRVLIGEETIALTPIIGSTDIADPITIDIAYELAKSGYELDINTYLLSSIVVLPNQDDTASTAIANISENTITYTPGSSHNGLERLLYSYTNGNSVLAGVIEIATSSYMNAPPVANNFEYPNIVGLNTEQVIDVGQYITDDDSDSLQLIDVFGFDSTNLVVEDLDGDGKQDFDSTKFTFQSNVSGSHEVTYTVTDQKGGYASGVIHIEVEADFRMVQSWEDITVPDLVIGADVTFTGPLSKLYADYIKASYSQTYTGDGVAAPAAISYVASSFDDASQICSARGGRLPIERELRELYLSQGSVFQSDNWPAAQPFWLADKTAVNQAKVFNLDDGSSNVSLIDDPNITHLVSCVLLNSEKIKNFSFQNKAINDPTSGSAPYTISGTVVDPDGNAAAYQKVHTSVEDSSRGNVGSAMLFSDQNGFFVQTYYDYSMSPNILNVSVLGDSEVELLDILRDEYLLGVDDPSAWNRLALTHQDGVSQPLRPHTTEGLPLLYNQTQSTNVYNRSSFKGADFIAELQLTTPGVALSGKYEFYMQQVSPLPDSSWGPSHMEPGAPDSNKTFSVVINIYNNKVDIFSGYRALLASYTIDLKGERKVWFEAREGIFSLYTVAGVEGEKPSEPLISTPMDWAGIDPNNPYWVGLGGYNGSDIDATELIAQEVLFRSFAR